VLVHADGAFEMISSDDAVLGTFTGMSFKNVTRELRAGDRVVIVSDGYLECVDCNDEELGTERLAAWVREERALNAQQMHERLTERLLKYCDSRLDDDVTLMVVAAD
jgi:serine phosphatase RsbU (regulator of sigma subunit)